MHILLTILSILYRIVTRLLVLGGRYLRRRARAMYSPVRPVALASAAVLTLACSDGAHVTDPVRSEAPAFAIADAARGFKQGFYWLPPMVKNPVTTGTFDAELSPVVEICPLAGDECDPSQDLIETFTTEGTGSTTIRAGGGHYIVNWRLREYDLTGSTHYRISVFAGPGVLLGYADVEPVTNGRGLKNVNTGEYIGLVDNRTLPIKFRIETGFVASIGIEPGAASIPLGQTQRFTATVTDLHGGTLAVPVVWTSENESVASVDGGGLATGVGPGSTTITGSFGHVSASAALTVEPAGGAWAQISAGGQHTCAVTTAGQAFCWGLGSSGQLGNGGTNDQLSPVAVAGNHQFASISAADGHTCGVTTDGEAFCWGLDNFSQLGNGGTTDDQATPVAVAGNHRFASISAIIFHTCGVTTDGEAFCWGSGRVGELGNGGTDDQLSPVAVAGNHQFASISVGFTHSCGMTTDGRAFCWGSELHTPLGAGGAGHSGVVQLSPVAVLGNHQFASLDAGGRHTCGVTMDGEAFCWGRIGALGIGFSGVGTVDEPRAVLGTHQFASISAGGIHTCGVTTDEEAFCWGRGNFFSLGNGGTTDTQEASPVAVAGNHRFASVSAGRFHTCGVTTGGEAYCWGRGTSGELGEGRMVNRSLPVRVSDPF